MKGKENVETGSPVTRLLKLLDVNRVIHVDDAFSGGIQLTDVLAALDVLTGEELAKISGDFERFPEDPEPRKEKFREYWEKLDANARKEIGEKIVNYGDSDASPEHGSFQDVTDIDTLFVEVEYIPLGREAWLSKKATYIDETNDYRTLFIIDHDLSGDGGSVEEGMNIINELMHQTDKDKALLCLLTGTASHSNQDRVWQEYSEHYNTERDRFFLIPKDAHMEGPEEFTKMLRLAILIPDFVSFREEAWELMDRALKESKERIQDISIIDFEHMVLKIPSEQGGWEPDILFRLYGIFHRRASQKLAYEDADLEIMASKLRKVSHLGANLRKSKASDRVHRIENESRYDDRAIINRQRIPLQLGDIFQITKNGSEELYMLLSQPCDLSLRPKENGSRKLEVGNLVCIEVFSKNKYKKSGANKEYLFELEYFDSDSASIYAINFIKTLFFDLNILDMCAFNAEGNCSLDITSSCPDNVIPAMAMRYNILQDKLKDFIELHNINHIDTGQSDIYEEIKGKMSKIYTKFCGVCPTIEGNSIEFPIQRIKRLRFDYATEVLRQYAGYMSRTAFDVDLARSVDNK